MPSFDIVCEVDAHELDNVIDQCNRTVTTRFDFKDADASFTLKDATLTLSAASAFHIKQMQDILAITCGKRNIALAHLDYGELLEQGQRASQAVTVKQGIDRDEAKKIIKLIKDSKLKVQTQVQGEQVRVTGKKRDDLQQVMSLLKESSLALPVKFENFRD